MARHGLTVFEFKCIIAADSALITMSTATAWALEGLQFLKVDSNENFRFSRPLGSVQETIIYIYEPLSTARELGVLGWCGGVGCAGRVYLADVRLVAHPKVAWHPIPDRPNFPISKKDLILFYELARVSESGARTRGV